MVESNGGVQWWSAMVECWSAAMVECNGGVESPPSMEEFNCRLLLFTCTPLALHLPP